jgi:pimeloyl-ACP methyl ester carboxylesterase
MKLFRLFIFMLVGVVSLSPIQAVLADSGLKPDETENLRDDRSSKEFIYPVLFVHGLGSNSSTWNNVKSELIDQGYEYGGNYENFWSWLNKGDFYTINIKNTTNTNFDELGEKVADAVEKIRDVTGARKVILVGHSLGGLASRSYLNTYPGDVAALLTIGTPNGGSYLGYADDFSTDIKNVDGNKLIATGLNFYCEMKKSCSGSTADALEPDSPELRRLNSISPPQDVLYLSVIGTSRDYESVSWFEDLKAEFAEDFLATFTRYYDDRNVSICSAGVLINFTDNVVPVCSQYLFSLFLSKDYEHYEFYLDGVDHTRQTTDPEGVDVIIEALEFADDYLR